MNDNTSAASDVVRVRRTPNVDCHLNDESAKDMLACLQRMKTATDDGSPYLSGVEP